MLLVFSKCFKPASVTVSHVVFACIVVCDINSEDSEEAGTPVKLTGYKVAVGCVTSQVFTFTYDSFTLGRLLMGRGCAVSWRTKSVFYSFTRRFIHNVIKCGVDSRWCSTNLYSEHIREIQKQHFYIYSFVKNRKTLIYFFSFQWIKNIWTRELSWALRRFCSSC